jgi:hypothetical protein
MKSNKFLAALVSTAAVCAGVLLASEAQAVGCPFAKGLNKSSQNIDNSALPFKAAILGGSALATGAGIFAVRRLADARRAEHPEFSSTDELVSADEVFASEAVEAPVQEVAAEEKETALVR